MQRQCHGYIIYSNCNMNELILSVYYPYCNKLVQAGAVNLQVASHYCVVTSMPNTYIIRFCRPTVIETVGAWG